MPWRSSAPGWGGVQRPMAGSSGRCANSAVTLAGFMLPPGTILQRNKRSPSWSGPGVTDAHLWPSFHSFCRLQRQLLMSSSCAEWHTGVGHYRWLSNPWVLTRYLCVFETKTSSRALKVFTVSVKLVINSGTQVFVFQDDATSAALKHRFNARLES